MATPREPLRPAFDSDLQMAAFSALILIALAGPLLLAYLHPRDRQYAYGEMRESDGAFSFVRHEIFDTKDDIDILFAGNSTLWAGINSPIVGEELARRLGRPANVVTFGSYWPSMDVPYMEIRDALEHKRIGMVVLSIPGTDFNDGPSPVAFRFLNYGDPPEVTAGLPLRYRVGLYAGYVLRSPRDLLSWLRPTRSIPSPYARYNGSMVSDAGFYQAAFEPFTPPVPAVAAGSLIYSAATRGSFEYTGHAPPPYQMYYLKKLSELLKARHVALVIVSIPQYDDRRGLRVIERENWPNELGPESAMVGVRPATLFGNLGDSDIAKLYFDKVHLNRNGSELFTRTIAPALLEVYGKR